MSIFETWFQNQPDPFMKFQRHAIEIGWKGAVEVCAAEVKTAGCRCPDRAMEADFVALPVKHRGIDGTLVDLGYKDRHVFWCPIALAYKLLEMAR